MLEIDLAYVAGFFDGEGCISIESNNSHLYYVRVSIANTDLDVIQWVLELFPGGKINVMKSNKRPVFYARWNSKFARHFLETVLPYMRIKKSQAELTLELMDTLGKYKRVKNFTELEKESMMDIVDAIHTLKHAS